MHLTKSPEGFVRSIATDAPDKATGRVCQVQALLDERPIHVISTNAVRRDLLRINYDRDGEVRSLFLDVSSGS